MINEIFQGRLTKFGTKTTKDGEVVAEFNIQHKSEQPTQYFLDSFSDVFGNDVKKCMDSTDWKSIAFDVEGSHIEFSIDGVDEMKMPAEIVAIKVGQKIKDGESTFTYNIVLNKLLNPNTDSVFATTYLNRKEEDEDGKTKIAEYDILMKK
jgi:hypothetical protein